MTNITQTIIGKEDQKMKKGKTGQVEPGDDIAIIAKDDQKGKRGESGLLIGTWRWQHVQWMGRLQLPRQPSPDITFSFLTKIRSLETQYRKNFAFGEQM